MALPSESQDANGLSTVTKIPAGKKLIFVDPTTNEGGIITLENLTKQILENLTSQTFALDQGTDTIINALNKLNSKISAVETITINEHVTVIKNEIMVLIRIIHSGEMSGTAGEWNTIAKIPKEYAPITTLYAAGYDNTKNNFSESNLLTMKVDPSGDISIFLFHDCPSPIPRGTIVYLI